MMQTTCIGERRHSGMQEMGETREPMSADCWNDAQVLAQKYADVMQRDFWVLYAAKPHVNQHNAIVAGWEISVKRPPASMVGVLVFRWIHREKRLMVDVERCLPYDVPLSDDELSRRAEDSIPSLAQVAEKSGSILLA